MAEWLKAHAWKACIGETLSRVRIPLSPPLIRNAEFIFIAVEYPEKRQDPRAIMCSRIWSGRRDSDPRRPAWESFGNPLTLRNNEQVFGSGASKTLYFSGCFSNGY